MALSPWHSLSRLGTPSLLLRPPVRRMHIPSRTSLRRFSSTPHQLKPYPEPSLTPPLAADLPPSLGKALIDKGEPVRIPHDPSVIRHNEGPGKVPQRARGDAVSSEPGKTLSTAASKPVIPPATSPNTPAPTSASHSTPALSSTPVIEPKLPPSSGNKVTEAAAPAKPKRRSLLADRIKSKKAAITISPGALERLRPLAFPTPTAEDPNPEPRLLRISVKNKGCAGQSYHLEYIAPSAIGRFDEVVEQDGIRVVVDGMSLMGLVGCEMDWKEDRISSKFVFTNPNIKESCGCGESFHL